MFEHISRDRMVVQFAGARAGTEPLTWGQKAIFEDMRESGNQFRAAGSICRRAALSMMRRPGCAA